MLSNSGQALLSHGGTEEWWFHQVSLQNCPTQQTLGRQLEDDFCVSATKKALLRLSQGMDAESKLAQIKDKSFTQTNI